MAPIMPASDLHLYFSIDTHHEFAVGNVIYRPNLVDMLSMIG